MKTKLMYKIINSLAPQRLCEFFYNVNEIHNYNLRGSLTKLYIRKPKTELYLFSFVETPRKFIIAELSIRKLGSSKQVYCIHHASVQGTYYKNRVLKK